MSVNAEQIKQLRELTGAGVLEAKRTLEEKGGDFDKALAVLKEKSMARAEKKTEREARQGLIETYVHQGGRIGVLLEINCETDFVARTEGFKNLAHDLALQITATQPQYVSVAEIPASLVEATKKVFADAAVAEGKPAGLVEKIVAGKMDSFYREHCLLIQPFIRDESQTIQDLVKAAIAKLGENIVVRRFARFELGG